MSSGDVSRLRALIVGALRERELMTARQIVRAIRRDARVRTDVRSVRFILQAGGFARVRSKFVPFIKVARCRLAEAGPADGPGRSGAPVPARPYRPVLGGTAAAHLVFRDEDPPTAAVGRPI
jgi:hypothetical protein